MNQIQGVESALNRHGWSLMKFTSILDFGCGAGRLSRRLQRLVPDANYFGCDTDIEAATEAQRGCTEGRFIANKPWPPLDYETGQFDLVLSYSVFTNISEASHEAWLTELRRVLKNDGVMIHTLHSDEYLRRTESFSPEYLRKYEFSGTVQQVIESEKQYHFVSPDHWPDDYGFTVINKDYVLSQWPTFTGLSLVGFEDGAIESYPEGCQGIAILARESAPRHF